MLYADCEGVLKLVNRQVIRGPEGSRAFTEFHGLSRSFTEHSKIKSLKFY